MHLKCQDWGDSYTLGYNRLASHVPEVRQVIHNFQTLHALDLVGQKRLTLEVYNNVLISQPVLVDHCT